MRHGAGVFTHSPSAPLPKGDRDETYRSAVGFGRVSCTLGKRGGIGAQGEVEQTWPGPSDLGLFTSGIGKTTAVGVGVTDATACCASRGVDEEGT